MVIQEFFITPEFLQQYPVLLFCATVDPATDAPRIVSGLSGQGTENAQHFIPLLGWELQPYTRMDHLCLLDYLQEVPMLSTIRAISTCRTHTQVTYCNYESLRLLLKRVEMV